MSSTNQQQQRQQIMDYQSLSSKLRSSSIQQQQQQQRRKWSDWSECSTSCLKTRHRLNCDDLISQAATANSTTSSPSNRISKDSSRNQSNNKPASSSGSYLKQKRKRDAASNLSQVLPGAAAATATSSDEADDGLLLLGAGELKDDEDDYADEPELEEEDSCANVDTSRTFEEVACVGGACPTSTNFPHNNNNNNNNSPTVENQQQQQQQQAMSGTRTRTTQHVSSKSGRPVQTDLSPKRARKPELPHSAARSQSADQLAAAAAAAKASRQPQLPPGPNGISYGAPGDTPTQPLLVNLTTRTSAAAAAAAAPPPPGGKTGAIWTPQSFALWNTAAGQQQQPQRQPAGNDLGQQANLTIQWTVLIGCALTLVLLVMLILRKLFATKLPSYHWLLAKQTIKGAASSSSSSSSSRLAPGDGCCRHSQATTTTSLGYSCGGGGGDNSIMSHHPGQQPFLGAQPHRLDGRFEYQLPPHHASCLAWRNRLGPAAKPKQQQQQIVTFEPAGHFTRLSSSAAKLGKFNTDFGNGGLPGCYSVDSLAAYADPASLGSPSSTFSQRLGGAGGGGGGLTNRKRMIGAGASNNYSDDQQSASYNCYDTLGSASARYRRQQLEPGNGASLAQADCGRGGGGGPTGANKSCAYRTSSSERSRGRTIIQSRQPTVTGLSTGMAADRKHATPYVPGGGSQPNEPRATSLDRRRPGRVGPMAASDNPQCSSRSRSSSRCSASSVSSNSASAAHGNGGASDSSPSVQSTTAPMLSNAASSEQSAADFELVGSSPAMLPASPGRLTACSSSGQAGGSPASLGLGARLRHKLFVGSDVAQSATQSQPSSPLLFASASQSRQPGAIGSGGGGGGSSSTKASKRHRRMPSDFGTPTKLLASSRQQQQQPLGVYQVREQQDSAAMPVALFRHSDCDNGEERHLYEEISNGQQQQQHQQHS